MFGRWNVLDERAGVTQRNEISWKAFASKHSLSHRYNFRAAVSHRGAEMEGAAGNLPGKVWTVRYLHFRYRDKVKMANFTSF